MEKSPEEMWKKMKMGKTEKREDGKYQEEQDRKKIK